MAKRAFRTFVPTVRDEDNICDFGANDRELATGTPSFRS
jgi:hypothetical protein